MKQLMVRSRLKALPHRDYSDMQSNPAGCYKHQHGTRGRRCELCPRLKEGVTFMSNYTEKILKNLTRSDTTSHANLSIVYCVLCLPHNMQEVLQAIYRQEYKLHAHKTFRTQTRN